MLNSEVIERFKTPYSKGISSRSIRLSKRYIYSVVTGVRARLLSQEKKKGQRISNWAYQALPCVKLELVPFSNHPFIVNSGCKLLKSVHKIPALVLSADKYILKVLSLDGQTSFTETSINERKFKRGNKYAKNDPEFFLTPEGYLYITVTQKIENVRLEGIFVNPLDVYKFPSDCNDSYNPCLSNLDYEFPYEEDLIPALIELAAQETVNLFNSGKNDTSNNNADDGQRG